MDGKKVRIGKLFDNAWGVQRHSADEETSVASGVDGYWLTQEDIEHLLKGGVIGFDDGEYGHFLRVKKAK